jgi:hypothetical protein
MSNNNNRMIVFASILGAILATSILALNPSTITNVGAQMYGDQYGYDSNYYQDDNRYGYDNNHPEKKNVNVQKIKCVNSNINVNGVDITKIPRDDIAGVAAANEAGEGPDGANTQNGNGLGDKINFDRNLVNVCVNVNDNEQTKVTPPGETPPEPVTGNLLVSKFVTCEPGEENGGGLTSVQQTEEPTDPCDDLETDITSSDFGISMAGFQPVDPTSFQGSESGQNVLLGVGPYAVTETPDASVETDVAALEEDHNVVIDGPIPAFDEECTQSAINEFVGTGIMTEGDLQTCKITNNFQWFPGDEELVTFCHCDQGSGGEVNCNTRMLPQVAIDNGHIPKHEFDHLGACTGNEGD